MIQNINIYYSHICVCIYICIFTCRYICTNIIQPLKEEKLCHFQQHGYTDGLLRHYASETSQRESQKWYNLTHMWNLKTVNSEK